MLALNCSTFRFPFQRHHCPEKSMTSIARAAHTTLLSMTLLLLASAFAARASAQGGPGSSQVILPNPTPRPVDPHDIFRDDPVARAREQQVQALKRTQKHAQVVIDANNILLLAQQIRDHRAINDTSGIADGADLVGAQQIEKLAKRVKDNSKIQ
jgi:hypothetical protein